MQDSPAFTWQAAAVCSKSELKYSQDKVGVEVTRYISGIALSWQLLYMSQKNDLGL
jgi:hypothetical protein